MDEKFEVEFQGWLLTLDLDPHGRLMRERYLELKGRVVPTSPKEGFCSCPIIRNGPNEYPNNCAVAWGFEQGTCPMCNGDCPDCELPRIPGCPGQGTTLCKVCDGPCKAGSPGKMREHLRRF